MEKFCSREELGVKQALSHRGHSGAEPTIFLCQKLVSNLQEKQKACPPETYFPTPEP